MALYEISSEKIQKIEETSFSSEGLLERQHLQRLLRSNIGIVALDTLIISEECSEWIDSYCRIDLLGVDKQANLVVIELKRSEDGGHMELQSIRYAAMISAMTFAKAVEVYTEFLNGIEIDRPEEDRTDAQASLLDFLNWEEPDDNLFAQDVRIVLVSANFSKVLTTSVLWLNEYGLQIKCIRIKPYKDNGRILVDVQQIIPIPEAQAYQTQLKEKQQQERAARTSHAERTKYQVTVDGQTFEPQSKRSAIYTIVRHLVERGHSPEKIAMAVPWRQNAMFRIADGKLNSEEFIARQIADAANAGVSFDVRRFYCHDEKLLYHNGKTYVFTNQWGPRCLEAIDALSKTFPEVAILCRVAE